MTAAPVILARVAGAVVASIGGAAMAGDRPEFDDLMIEAHRATVALDDVTRRDGSKVTAGPVSNGKRLYTQLREYQRSARMTSIEAHALDSALEQLQARLKFFGEAV